jgi:hypothetical protein
MQDPNASFQIRHSLESSSNLIRRIEGFVEHSTETLECRMCPIHPFVHKNFLSDLSRCQWNQSSQRILEFSGHATRLILNPNEIERGEMAVSNWSVHFLRDKSAGQ